MAKSVCDQVFLLTTLLSIICSQGMCCGIVVVSLPSLRGYFATKKCLNSGRSLCHARCRHNAKPENGDHRRFPRIVRRSIKNKIVRGSWRVVRRDSSVRRGRWCRLVRYGKLFSTEHSPSGGSATNLPWRSDLTCKLAPLCHASSPNGFPFTWRCTVEVRMVLVSGPNLLEP